MAGKVVCCHGPDRFDIYVGRGNGSIYGNPWSNKWGSNAHFKVKTRKDAVSNYERWLRGTDHKEFQQDLRQEILVSLPNLHGKTLACHCRPDELCHASILVDLANELNDAKSK